MHEENYGISLMPLRALIKKKFWWNLMVEQARKIIFQVWLSIKRFAQDNNVIIKTNIINRNEKERESVQSKLNVNYITSLSSLAKSK